MNVRLPAKHILRCSNAQDHLRTLYVMLAGVCLGELAITSLSKSWSAPKRRFPDLASY